MRRHVLSDLLLQQQLGLSEGLRANGRGHRLHKGKFCLDINVVQLIRPVKKAPRNIELISAMPETQIRQVGHCVFDRKLRYEETIHRHCSPFLQTTRYKGHQL